MRKDTNRKLINKISLVLLNIFMIISLILVLVYKNNFGYSLYWIITPLLILFILSLILKWSARGFDVDVNESKTIQRTYDDTTSLITVFFGFIFLAIHVVEI